MREGGLKSLQGLQRALRQQGEFDAAVALEDLERGVQSSDEEWALAHYRLVRECGYCVPYLIEDAEGIFQVALVKLTPELQQELLDSMRKQKRPVTHEEKLWAILDYFQLEPREDIPVPIEVVQALPSGFTLTPKD